MRLEGSPHPGTPDPGAAQFLHGLAPHQVDHLRFSVPLQPDRFSQFLEGPRTPPVAARFIVTPKPEDNIPKTKSARPTPTPNLKNGRSTTTPNPKSRGSTATPTSLLLLKEVYAPKFRALDWHRYITLTWLCVLNLVAAWDATFLSVALPTISTALNASALQAFWFGTSSLFAAAALQPLFISIAEIFGAKSMMLSAIVLFSGGTIVSALSSAPNFLLLGRSIQGIGAGGIYAITNVVIEAMSSRTKRRSYMLIGLMWAFGGITGPILGGAFATSGHWWWIFWINLPFCALAAVAISLLYPGQSMEGSTWRKLTTIDWIGSILFVGSFVSVLIFATWGRIVKPWGVWQTMVPLEVGLAAAVAFLVWSRFGPRNCYIPLAQSMNSTAFCAYLGAIVHGMGLWSVLYLMPIYLQTAKGLSPFTTAVKLLPWTCGISVFALFTALFIDRFGHYCPATWLGWAFTTLGVAILVLLMRQSPSAMWMGLSIVSGVGLGILAPALACAAQASSRNNDSAAIGTFTFFHILGRTFGVAVGGAIFQNQLATNLVGQSGLERKAMDFARNALVLIQKIQQMPGGKGTEKYVLIDAFVDSIRLVWIVLALIAGITSLLCVIGIREFEPRLNENGRSHELKTIDPER